MTAFLRTATVRCFLAAACLIAITATQVNADDRDTTTKVNGIISQMRSGLIMAGTAAGSSGLPLYGVFQILPKYHPVDPGVEPRQWIRAALQLLQAVVVTKQSGLWLWNGVHAVFYHIAFPHSADLGAFTKTYLSF